MAIVKNKKNSGKVAAMLMKPKDMKKITKGC